MMIVPANLTMGCPRCGAEIVLRQHVSGLWGAYHSSGWSQEGRFQPGADGCVWRRAMWSQRATRGEMEATVAGLCRRIVDRVCEAGSCDFVWDIAAPLPLMMIADLLGFPEEVHDDLLRWSDDMLRGTAADAPA